MSEATPNDDDLEEKYSDEPEYTVTVNGNKYALNQQARDSIQARAEREYAGNHLFDCFWKVASAEDAQNSDLHEVGDPLLVIETEGPFVPWDKLDQLELEMQDTSSFGGVDQGSSDVDEGGGMKTVKPGEVSNGAGDDTREKNRTHFAVTPQDFQEVPSPEGEDPERVPPKPEKFDEPTMVVWVPDNPDVEHTWSSGEAITAMFSWVEWNVQAKADQPRMTTNSNNSHTHWESLLQSHGCEKVGELAPKQKPEPPKKEESGSAKRKGDEFENGKYGGNNWTI